MFDQKYQWQNTIKNFDQKNLIEKSSIKNVDQRDRSKILIKYKPKNLLSKIVNQNFR